MTLLDRYIARQYLFNVLALSLILFCFVVTVDVSLNIDRFSKAATERLASSGEITTGLQRSLMTVTLVADLWWPRLLHLFNLLLGVVLVGAMGFTCTRLVRHGELVAMLSSGQSVFRVARPILLVALLLTGVQAIDQEVVMPRIAPLLARDAGDAGKHDLGTTAVPLTRDGAGRLFYARLFDADLGTLDGLSVIERDETGLATRRISAAHAAWSDGGWNLTSPTAQNREGGAPGSVEPAPARIETDLDPTALKMQRFRHYSQNLSWSQLGEMASRLRGLDSEQARQTRDGLNRIRFGRLSTMTSNLLTLVISMPFFLTRVPRNMLVQSLKCAPIGILALIGGALGAAAPIPGVPVALAVFVPVMVLIPIAIATTTAVRS